MKHLKTLITLFLLVIGTGMSWAEFKDFEIDLRTAVPTTSGVIPNLPDGVTQIDYPGHVDAATYNGAQHGWQWCAIEFPIDGLVDITIGGCNFQGGAYGYVEDENGNKLNFENKSCDEIYTVVYTGESKSLKLYCGQFCPYIKVRKHVNANNFEIDLSQDSYTLPEGVVNIKYPGNESGPHSHGWRYFATEFVVDGPVDITIGGCNWQNDVYGYLVADGGDPVYFANNSCSGTDTQKYTGKAGKYHVLKLYCGQYCPSIKVSVDYDGVKRRITAIGNVEYTKACEAKIKSARAAYDALSEDDKTKVSNYSFLVDAEKNFKNMKPTTVPTRTIIWDWENATATSLLMQESSSCSIYSRGYIHASNIIINNQSVETAGVTLAVTAADSEFKVKMSGNAHYAILSEGSKIMVPIRRAEDVVTIVCAPGTHACTIGSFTVDNDSYEYVSTQEDADRGYALITATGTTNIFNITVVQNGFDDVLPMITLNSAGWASFTSLVQGYTVVCPLGTQAYIATAVEEEYGDYGRVTLTPVNKFAYGQGVFIKGDKNAQIYANIAKGDESEIPADHKMTVGCTEDEKLFSYERSGAYVIATYKAGTPEEKSGFYRVDVDELIIPAGKAYLYAPKVKGAKELRITFADGEEATGVESVIAGAKAETPTVFYNLSGQKVDKNYKGIVIGNDGKKYVK